MLLGDELRALGGEDINTQPAGVYFKGTRELSYRVLLWSRLANQLYETLTEFPHSNDWEAYYRGLRAIAWPQYFTVDKTLAVSVDIIGNTHLTHSQYAVQRAKDAMVDCFREHGGERPTVQLVRPDVAIQVLITQTKAIVNLNLSGESLHRRGYRLGQGKAPLKENLAAAILLRARWPEFARAGKPLVDLMCGSGTLLIEAALMAAKIAPGLLRDYFAVKGLRSFARTAWEEAVAAARAQTHAELGSMPRIFGYDADPSVLLRARENIARAGLAEVIVVEQRTLSATPPTTLADPGLLVINPPYGERLGLDDDLPQLYQSIGRVAKECFPGWQLSIFSGNPALLGYVKISPEKVYKFFNGRIPCELWNGKVRDAAAAALGAQPEARRPLVLSPGAEMVKNRLVKNLRHLQKWAKRTGVTCYRIYDADLPEYAAAVDFYAGRYLHVQEYAPPQTIAPEKARQRLRELVAALQIALDLPRRQIFIKTRMKQRGKKQYQQLGSEQEYFEVTEGPAKFLVNFSDYLDTGLFLDARLIRQLVFARVKGRSFLNLFAYTGSASVYAGLAAARKIVTVDMSRTYLDWAQRNFVLNQLPLTQHEFIQADCLAWLQQNSEKFAVILLDPPTFSNSKRMNETLDITRDHVRLIDLAMAHLAPGGLLIFVTNKQKFKLAADLFERYRVEEITRSTVPEDFKRHGTPHYAFLLGGR